MLPVHFLKQCLCVASDMYMYTYYDLQIHISL